MKILTYNVNFFRGSEITNENYQIENCNEKIFNSIIPYLKDFLKKFDSVVILQEVPNKYKSNTYWHTHPFYKKIHNIFCIDTGYKIIENDGFSLSKTIAIFKKDSNFTEEKKNKLIMTNYKNKFVQLNHCDDITILGVHMPIKLIVEEDFIYCKQTWQELISYLKENNPQKIIIAGDFNAYKYCEKLGAFTKEYNEILNQNFVDTIDETTTIYNTPIDHILVSNSLKNCSLVDKSASFSDHYPVICDINL